MQHGIDRLRKIGAPPAIGLHCLQRCPLLHEKRAKFTNHRIIESVAFTQQRHFFHGIREAFRRRLGSEKIQTGDKLLDTISSCLSRLDELKQDLRQPISR